MSPSPVLVGLDPERGDNAPLVLGAALARLTRAPLIALAAYLHDPITDAVSAGTVEEQVRETTATELEEVAGESGAHLIVAGGSSPARVLHDEAGRLGAALLVVGSTGRGPLGRLAPGATAERLLHGAPCPVVVAPPELADDWSPRKIGVGFVDLEESHAALRAGAALARAAGGTVRARTVLDPLAYQRSAVIGPYAIGNDIEPSTDVARRALERALSALPSGATLSGEVVIGTPAEELRVLSERVDLLVCGSRGYGPLRAVLLGGVTHPLIANSACPVLIVPRGTEEALAIAA